MARWAGLGALAAAVIVTVVAFTVQTSSSPADVPSALGVESPPAASATELSPTKPSETEAPIETESAPDTSATPSAPTPPAATTTHGAAPSPSSQPSAKPAPSAKPPAKAGKPKGAPCTRSSECASMVCVAETCQ